MKKSKEKLNNLSQEIQNQVIESEQEGENDFISLKEAAVYSIVYSQEYLSLRARRGKLKAVKFGRNWLTKKEWVDEYKQTVNGYKEYLAKQIEAKNKTKDVLPDISISDSPNNPNVFKLPDFSRAPFVAIFSAAVFLLMAVGFSFVSSMSETKLFLSDVRYNVQQDLAGLKNDLFSIKSNLASVSLPRVSLPEIPKPNFALLADNAVGISRELKEFAFRQKNKLSRLWENRTFADILFFIFGKANGFVNVADNVLIKPFYFSGKAINHFVVFLSGMPERINGLFAKIESPVFYLSQIYSLSGNSIRGIIGKIALFAGANLSETKDGFSMVIDFFTRNIYSSLEITASFLTRFWQK